MTYCSTQAPLTQGSRGVCVSTSCGHASCSRPSDTRLPHAYLHHPSSLPGSSIQSLACKMRCYGMSICVPAVHTRQRFSDPLLHPNAPHRGVEGLLRQRVMRPRIMHQAVRHKASSHKPPSPLFPPMLENPESGMQNALLWHVDLRTCCSYTSPPQRPTAPPQRSSPRGREASASACHAATIHAAGRQTQAFLTQTSITPLPYQARASRVWHAKCGAMPSRFACLLFSHVTASPI